LGYKLLGPISIFTGPTLFYNLSNKTNADSFDMIKNKLNFGYHLGLRLNLGNIGLDFRYEKGGSSMIAETANLENTDLRVNQIILGLSFKIS
jgi:hypothetical protein